MGFEDDCFSESVDDMIDVALASKNPWLTGIDRGRLEREGHVRLNFVPVREETADVATRVATKENGSRTGQVARSNVETSNWTGETPGAQSNQSPFLPFAAGNFPTPSGKAEFYSEILKSQGLDPVVEFVPPTESRHSPQAKEFPLELLARKADNFLNSTFSNLPSIEKMEELGLLEISSADANARRINNGDKVRVFNRRGEIILSARVDGKVQPGVVSASLYWAKLTPGNRNINVLTSEKLTDLGNSATFYSVLVEVERFHAPS
jgi:anaerobic selenocysteine-containing dehydrogenase